MGEGGLKAEASCCKDMNCMCILVQPQNLSDSNEIDLM